MEKAKIFVSCGQRKNSLEIEIAKKVCNLIKSKGFDVFLATEIQSLGALTDVIYQELENCEYVLFIDFKRDLCVDPTGESRSFYRGSLFSHQELAIASYLEKDCLLFREKGMPLEGIQQFLVSNAIEFDSNTDSLFNALDSELGKWKVGWKNQLMIDLAQPIYEDAFNINSRIRERYYHISVFNNHFAKHAKNCFAYLLDLSCGPEGHTRLKNSELVWSGYGINSMTILPKDKRELDIFVLPLENNPNGLIYFPSLATSGYYQPNSIILQNNTFREVKIKLVSDNFQTLVESFIISKNKSGVLLFEKGDAFSEIVWDEEER